MKYSYVGNYGIVKITGGKFKGKFGYYDDDDIDFDNKRKSVIYFGEMFDNAKYYFIEQKYVTNDFNVDDLKKRQSEIIHQLWQNITVSKRLELLEEKGLIDAEINRRIEEYIDSNKLANKKVFLSHSSYDKSMVVSVALDLQESGISTWLDAIDILPGESIVEKINKGLSECKYVLLFLSNNSVKSSWVTKEWETMLWDEINTRTIKIIPVKLDECEIPKILQTKKYIDFSTNYSCGLSELIHTIKEYEKSN